MNRRSAFNLSAITILGLALLPGSAPAQQKTLKEQLVGTWTLVSWEQVQKDGTKQQDFGANPKGLASFDGNGRFFVMFARPELPKIASSDRTKVTPQEAQAINVGSIAYFGTYTRAKQGALVQDRVQHVPESSRSAAEARHHVPHR
jgi:Lipocalin-like domain